MQNESLAKQRPKNMRNALAHSNGKCERKVSHVLQAVFGSINSIANVENIKKALLHQMPTAKTQMQSLTLPKGIDNVHFGLKLEFTSIYENFEKFLENGWLSSWRRSNENDFGSFWRQVDWWKTWEHSLQIEMLRKLRKISWILSTQIKIGGTWNMQNIFLLVDQDSIFWKLVPTVTYKL